MKPRLLLHACCGPCAAGVLPRLTPLYNVIVWFYGSNIHPRTEYERRLEALRIVNNELNGGKEMIVVPYNEVHFLKAVEGLETELEGGARCEKCFEVRLRAAAEYAKQNGFDVFASTLSVSPHKNAQAINQIGNRLATRLGVPFLVEDFKKDGGFAVSVEHSRKLGIYRQKYCGCKFSQ